MYLTTKPAVIQIRRIDDWKTALDKNISLDNVDFSKVGA